LRLASFFGNEKMKTEFVDNQHTTEPTPKRATHFPRLDPSPKLNELKVSYRRRASKKHLGQTERPILNQSKKCFDYLQRVWDPDTLELREEFVLICLDQSLAVNGWFKLHTGGIGECMLDLRILFGVALKTASSAIVIAHNHPSGSVIPSLEDRNITRRVLAASKLLGIRCIDHLIVSRNEFYSFHEHESGLFRIDHLSNLLRWA
jgi:DNA repair protein RadC